MHDHSISLTGHDLFSQIAKLYVYFSIFLNNDFSAISYIYMVGGWFENAGDIDKLREMETTGEVMRSTSNNISVVVAKLTEIESLSEAFQGCRGVFHTSAFIDPAGLSGYTVSFLLTFYLYIRLSFRNRNMHILST